MYYEVSKAGFVYFVIRACNFLLLLANAAFYTLHVDMRAQFILSHSSYTHRHTQIYMANFACMHVCM
jgi:hypothetical protein